MDKIAIRDYWGQILGWIETEKNGNKIARDYWGRILGKYIKNSDYTCDYWGKIVSRGDTVVNFIYNKDRK